MPDLRKRASAINARLRERYPDAKCSLDFRTPFELLIATILAAQSTDARVNIVTKSLFRKYPTPRAFADADLVAMEADVKQTGFFRNKARAVINCSKAIVEKHGGEVPRTMEELTALPGVGRKTANVVLGNAFGIPAGIVVDTHMTRVAGRLGLTSSADAEKIEHDLTPLLPRSEWTSFAHRVIDHGRETCIARKPHCDACVLNDLCPSAELPAATQRIGPDSPTADRRSRKASRGRSEQPSRPSSPSPSRSRTSRSRSGRKPSSSA